MNTKFIDDLRNLAQRHIPEDINPCEWSGGNYDDAYALGIRHGEIYQARAVMDAMGWEYTIEKAED